MQVKPTSIKMRPMRGLVTLSVSYKPPPVLSGWGPSRCKAKLPCIKHMEQTLDPDTKRKLAELEARHKRHQMLMDEQKDRKVVRKQQHRSANHLNHKPVYRGNLY